METASEAVDPYRDDPVEVRALVDLEPSRAAPATGVTAIGGAAAEVATSGAATPGAAPAGAATAGGATADRALPAIALPRTRRRARRLSVAARQELLWICVIYVAARAVLVLAAVLLDAFGHRDLQGELANWDGLWYRAVANHGYPHQISFHQTNLGFFPLFPISIYLLSPAVQLVTQVHDPIWAATAAGVLISGVGGLITTVLVHRLVDGWWGRETARRATVLFVVFPGSVVFSMVYSEALLLPLAAGCIWALERRRWLLAGALAGLGTAVQPVGLLLGAVCAAACVRELWRGGWRAREFRLSLAATVMSASGAVAFMSFLWAWTGNPFANYIVQHHAWSEKTDPLALVHLVTREIPRFDPAHFNHPAINLNDIVGLIGAFLMAWELWLLWRYRRELSLPAIVWTLGITFLAFTSEYVPPNPRMLLTAFPMLVLIARHVRGRRFPVVVTVNVVLLVFLSLLTFYAHVLRP